MLEPKLFNELRLSLDRYLASGHVATAAQIEQQIKIFQERFGPPVLRQLDGEALLKLMHGRDDPAARCLMYWLEFKNDDEFAGYRFGGIGGGQALKFGIYQRQADHEWIGGSPTTQRVLSVDEAVDVARRQRDELLAGDAVLKDMPPNDTSDDAYARLQTAMEKAAPELAGDGWAHKYWFLANPDRLDDFHSPRWQRYHLIKLLQTPPDGAGILDGTAPRYVCAGRFVALAREFDVPVATLDSVLNERNGSLHRYWRVGTTDGNTSYWNVMRDGEFVSLGWPAQVPDLSSLIGGDRTANKGRIRDWLLPLYPTNPGVATRKAGEILNLADVIAENDLVVACNGQTAVGIGRVRGAYEYKSNLAFPHTRPVEWLSLDPWQMPHPEGLQTTVFELGRNASNLLALERQRQLLDSGAISKAAAGAGSEASAAPVMPELDRIAARVESILQRKGQLILYGPPGTGKTYHALRVARELASRRAFGKTFGALPEAERTQIEGPDGLVRLCTFHPGYGYEDFMEGLRPRTTASDQMVFEPRDGIFKKLCFDAIKAPQRSFYLIVDEINRGDVPRIFGELISIIEQDKRGKPIILPITMTSFAVPENVFLLGTMNTADRSISLLDTALRRRFGFVELMPDSSLLSGKKAGELPLGPWLEGLNTRLRQQLKRDARNLQIGHAYLMRVTSAAEFTRVLRDELIPLLEEYCYEDFDTLKSILGNSLVDTKKSCIQEDMFEPHREADLLQAMRFEEMEGAELAQLAAGVIPEDGGDDTEAADATDDPAS